MSHLEFDMRLAVLLLDSLRNNFSPADNYDSSRQFPRRVDSGIGPGIMNSTDSGTTTTPTAQFLLPSAKSVIVFAGAWAVALTAA